MVGVNEYINARLDRLTGYYKIYKNKEGKFLHLPKDLKIKVDTDFWQLIKIVKA